MPASRNMFVNAGRVKEVAGTTDYPLFSSTGLQYSNGLAIDIGAPIGYSEAGSTVSNLRSYGISTIPYTTAANAFTLAAPVVGEKKILYMNSTAISDSTAINTSVYTGSTAIFIKDNSTAYAPKLYANLQPPYAYLELIGLTTAEWGVVNAYGGVQLTTAIGYTT